MFTVYVVVPDSVTAWHKYFEIEELHWPWPVVRYQDQIFIRGVTELKMLTSIAGDHTAC